MPLVVFDHPVPADFLGFDLLLAAGPLHSEPAAPGDSSKAGCGEHEVTIRSCSLEGNSLPAGYHYHDGHEAADPTTSAG
jgi:hypothetical protein